MTDFALLRPSLAWLLVLAPLSLAAGWLALARSRRELALWVSERRRARFLAVSPARERALPVLGAAGVAFLALAALGPVLGHTYRAVSREGLDLVVCLDTSRSMLAQDLRPSRLERAKREVVGLLDLLRGDRVALVAFSGDARDVAPLTRDKGTLEGLLAYVSPDDNREGGTDLAAALERALQLFDGRTGAHEAILLLTDGEDLEGQAAAQAEEAARRNIRVFVVGVGTEAGGKIPVVQPDGTQGFLRDPEGNEVVSKLGGAGLAALAARTGGEYLTAEQSPTPLEDLYRARVTRIQGREIEGGERRVPYDRYQWPLGLGIACLALELALRPRGRREPRGESPRLAAALLPLLALGGGEETRAPSLAGAVELFERGELVAAEEAARALVAQPPGALTDAERARAHYALGLITATRALGVGAEAGEDAQQAANADREAAGEAFSAARALAGPGELRLDAIYGLGVLELDRAERVRARIPEISGVPPAPPPQPAAPDAPPPPAPPDPLPEARELYRGARTWFVERLRLEHGDEDTRANLELIQRRLHELDEIEKKREEQENQQDQQDQDKEGDESKDGDPKKDEKKSDDEKKDEQQKGDEKQDEDGENEGDEPKDPEQEPKPPEEPKPGEEQPEEPQQPPEPQPEGAQPEEEQTEQEPASQAPAERVLTREEVMQLLDKLAELEKQQKALQALMRSKQQKKAKRDW